MTPTPWEELTCGPLDRRRFVLTDRVTGWYEGYTHAPDLGGGYRPRDEALVTGWRSSWNGHPLNRAEKALTDTVLPWGQRVVYPDGCVEELLLHTGRRVLSLRLTGPTPGRPSIEVGIPTPLPKGWHHQRLEEAGPQGLTVHLVFGESRAEVRATAATLGPGAWEAEVDRRRRAATAMGLSTGDLDTDRALFWAAASAQSFLTQEFGLGLWAGLPWFKDNWGRDTFIALPGALLATGAFAEARGVLENFARYQNLDPTDRNRGRIPNRVNRSEILYNTVDGTPWLIRELGEYRAWTGDTGVDALFRPLIRRYVDGALANYVDDEGLMHHDDADTWMDARIAGTTPWSPRGDRAVEIQALWIEALEVGARLAVEAGDEAEAARYRGLADRARRAFEARFVVDGRLVDRLEANHRPDLTRRPNALLLAWINREPPGGLEVLRATTVDLVNHLLVDEGLLSLDPTDPRFHPRHEAPARWHKDAAYHNGTIWNWNAGFAVTALTRFGWADRAWAVTQGLVRQVLEGPTLGTLAELVDALPGPDGRPVASGTFSQAWSVSELVRNAWQDYLGWTPDLIAGELRFRPHLPSAWTRVRAQARWGAGHGLSIAVDTTEVGEQRQQVWVLSSETPLPRLVVEVDGVEARVEAGAQRAELVVTARVEPTPAPPGLRLRRPEGGWPVEQGVDVLEGALKNSLTPPGPGYTLEPLI